MRFVLVSTHTDQTTGYSKVVFNLLKQLATMSPRVKVFHFGFQRHPSQPGFRKAPAGINQYDAAANEDPKEEGFGFNKIKEYIEMVGPDVVMIYNDPLVIYKFIEAMGHDRSSSPYKLWTYVDQVYNGIAQPLMNAIKEHSDRVYVFTDIWRNALIKQYGEFQDVRVLEHGVDSTTFSSLPAEARRTLRTNLNIPADATVFLNANRNSQRKRLDLSIQGFARLLAKNPSMPYYMIVVTNVNPQAGSYYDLVRIFAREIELLGLPQEIAARLLLIDSSGKNVITDEGINQIYNLADIGINTSDGEGFGLCQLEHMLTGAPQIVTDVGSYRTFLDDSVAAFISPRSDVYCAGTMPLGGWAPSFDPNDVATAMEHVSSNLADMKQSVAGYPFKTWSTVCDSWLEDVMSA